MFNGKNILITGGTGSFGKKYTEILLKKYNPNKLITQLLQIKPNCFLV